MQDAMVKEQRKQMNYPQIREGKLENHERTSVITDIQIDVLDWISRSFFDATQNAISGDNTAVSLFTAK